MKCAWAQFVDDVLDFTGSTLQLGKPALNDLRSGLATAPVLYAAQVRLSRLRWAPAMGPSLPEGWMLRVLVLCGMGSTVTGRRAAHAGAPAAAAADLAQVQE